jgi:hypothetical protein
MMELRLSNKIRQTPAPNSDPEADVHASRGCRPCSTHGDESGSQFTDSFSKQKHKRREGKYTMNPKLLVISLTICGAACAAEVPGDEQLPPNGTEDVTTETGAADPTDEPSDKLEGEDEPEVAYKANFDPELAEQLKAMRANEGADQ